MTQKIIVGADRALEVALGLAAELALECTGLPLHGSDRYNFDIVGLLQDYPAANHEVFVALDSRAINYTRLKLLAAVRLAGYRSFDLISSQASVAADARLLGNVLVETGCHVAPRCVLGAGSWLHRQVVLEQDVRLGSGVTLHNGVLLGEGSALGSGTTLGARCHTAPASVLGKHCEWLLPGQVPAVLADRCFFDALMPSGAQVFNYQPA